MRVAPAPLRAWVVEILAAAGAGEEAAEATADALVDANLRGLDSHGVIQLDFYLRRLRNGAIDGRAHPAVVVDLPAAAVVDGRNALGPYAATVAMRVCCEKAHRAGAAVVAVRDSNHFGAASVYSELAARDGCVGIAMSNSDAGLAPRGSLGPVLGTNPLGIAAPPADGLSLPSLDIASSVVAQTRVIVAARKGEAIPDGWAIGPDGAGTTDAAEALRGAVLPVGDYKGFGLAFMIDVLAGCVAGALVSPEIETDVHSPHPQRIGHFLAAVDVQAFREAGEYRRHLTELVAKVHGAPRANGTPPFLTPGEREASVAGERRESIPLDEASVALLRALGEEFGVPVPLPEQP